MILVLSTEVCTKSNQNAASNIVGQAESFCKEYSIYVISHIKTPFLVRLMPIILRTNHPKQHALLLKQTFLA